MIVGIAIAGLPAAVAVGILIGLIHPYINRDTRRDP